MKTNLKMFDDKGQIADFDGLRLAAGNRSGAWGLLAAAVSVAGGVASAVVVAWLQHRWDRNRK